MTDTYIELHDQLGQLRRDFTETEVSQLTPQRQKLFFTLIEAFNAETDADAELAAAKDARAKAVADHAAVQAEHLRRNPPTSFLQALRAVQNRPTE